MKKLLFLMSAVFLTLNIIGQSADIDTIAYEAGVTTHKDVRDKVNETVVRQKEKADTVNQTFTGTIVLPITTSVGDVSSTEIGYINGLTSAAQTQITQNALDIDTLENDTIDINDVALEGSDYFIEIADSTAGSAYNYVTQTQLTATHNSADEEYYVRALNAAGNDAIAFPVGDKRVATSENMADGILYLTMIYIQKDTTLTGVGFLNATPAGDYNQADASQIGLYNLNGTNFALVASCADDSTLFTGTANSITKKAFTAPYVATSGIYYVALLCNWTGSPAAVPKLYNGTNNALSYLLIPNHRIACTSDAAQATLPATLARSATSSTGPIPLAWVY